MGSMQSEKSKIIIAETMQTEGLGKNFEISGRSSAKDDKMLAATVINVPVRVLEAGAKLVAQLYLKNLWEFYLQYLLFSLF